MSDQEIMQSELLKEPMTMGDVFVQSGLFPDIKTKAQAAVKILAGKELGLTPFQSMASIYIVSGRLSLTSQAMSSLIKKSNKYDYLVTKIDETECSIDFFSIDNNEKTKIGTSTFNLKDAARCGLANKETFKSYPRNLLFARALSNGARFYCPDAICGYYESSEVEDIFSINNKKTITINKDGEVLNEGNMETNIGI